MAKVLFVNLSKNTNIFMLQNHEAERYGHVTFNITDFRRPDHKKLRHIEYCNPTLENYLKKIRELHKVHKFDYITTQCENLYPLVDMLKDEINIMPIMDIDVNTLTCKEKFSKFAASIGIPHPSYIIPTSIEELRGFNVPIFVKPTNGSDGTCKLFMSEDKYSKFDYHRFDSGANFADVLEQHNAVDDFLDTQNNLRDMKIGKSVAGIKGRHIVQECVVSRESYIFNTVIIDGDVRLVNAMHSDLGYEPNMYIYGHGITNYLTFAESRNNQVTVRDFVGEDVYDAFMEQIHKVVINAGIKLAALDVTTVPYFGSYYLQDLQFRQGGSISRTIKVDRDVASDLYVDKILFDDIEYESVWKHV